MAKRIKIPKRVAGMKIPKSIRKGPLKDFANSSMGQMLLAEALVAAAGLFAVKRINNEDAGEVLRHPIDSLQRAGSRIGSSFGDSSNGLHRSTARLQFAMAEAVRAFREALADPLEPEAAGESLRSEEAESGKKKNRSSADQTAAH